MDCTAPGSDRGSRHLDEDIFHILLGLAFKHGISPFRVMKEATLRAALYRGEDPRLRDVRIAFQILRGLQPTPA